MTEPNAGSDTTRIETVAERKGDEYVINGQKMFISRVQHSDLMLLLARTSPYDEDNRSGNLSVFMVDLDAAGDSVRAAPLDMMINHSTNVVFIEDLHVPVENLIGEEGQGFRYILSGMNAERILIAAECLGDGYFFIETASSYASEREVFGRPIGKKSGSAVSNRGCLCSNRGRLPRVLPGCGSLRRWSKSGEEKPTWLSIWHRKPRGLAADVCMATLGGYGLAVEYDVERKFRETRLYRTAPVTNNLILAYLGHNVLGMPRSY